MTDAAGSRLGPYLVGQRLSTSGSTQWFEASDASLERPVSVLVTMLPADDAAASALREQARRLAAVTDARLLPVYGQGEDGPQLWLATRKTSGSQLTEVKSLERARAARLGAQLAEQLAALQEAGIVPAEIGADDVVVEGEGGREHAWLLPDPRRDVVDDPSAATRSLMRLLDERTDKKLLDDPSPDPATLSDQLSKLIVARSRRRPAVVAAAVVAGAVVAAILAVVLTRGTKSSAGVNGAIATVAARIPLNATLSALAPGDRDVWATTSTGALIHVDAKSNTVVGVPAKLFPANAYVDLVVDRGSLWAGGPGLLLRIDSSSGKVLDRRTLGKDQVDGLLSAEGSLWVTVNAGSDPRVRLFSYTGSTRRAGPGGSFGLYAVPVIESGGTVWAVSGNGSLTRVSNSGALTTISYGEQSGFPAVDGRTIWAPTRIDGTVVPIDSERMTLAPAVNLDGNAGRATAAAGSIWVLTSSPSLVYRIDPKTSEVLGSPLPVPDSASFLAWGAGSLWVDDPKAKALVRLTPTDPAPGAHPRPVGTDLRNGPMRMGVRLHGLVAGSRLSVEVPDDGWVAESAPGGPPQFELVQQKGQGVSISSTRQFFDRAGRLAPVRTPAAFLRALRARSDVRITRVQTVSLSGVPGIRVSFATTPKPPYPSLCGGSPCAVLYPIRNGTYVLEQGHDEFTIVKRGVTLFIVDASFGTSVDPLLAKRMHRLVDSIRFES